MEDWNVGRFVRNPLWNGIEELPVAVRTSVRDYVTNPLMDSVIMLVRNSVWDLVEG